MRSLAPGCQNLVHILGTNLPKTEMATAKSSFLSFAPSLVAHGKPTRRLHQQCLVCVTGGVGGSLKLRVDMRANWWRIQGGLNSNHQPSSLLSFFRPYQRYSELQTLAIERGREGSSSEVALSTSSNGQDVKLKSQRNGDGDNDNGGVDGDDDGMECIGTGLDVECVIPLKTVDAKASGKFPGRAVNSNGMGEKEGGDGEAGLLESVLDTMLLISPFFFWGTAMVAMKGILPKAGPMFVASTRLIPAGALLVGFASSRGRKMPSGAPAWLAIALFGLIDASCFQGFLAEGLRRTSAGLGSVIIDSQPLTVAVLAALLFGELLGPVAIVGLGLGVVGLVLLEVPLDVLYSAVQPQEVQGVVQSSSPSLQPSVAGEWSIWDSGEWWMLLAAQSMAVGTVMVRWVSQLSDPIMATGWHMILGGIPLLALSFWQHDPAVSGHLQDLNSSDWGALFYTSLFGSAISYGVFFYNATRGSLTKLSSLTFLTPMFAALFGYLLLDETLDGIQLAGACVTLFSIYLVNKKAKTDPQEE